MKRKKGSPEAEEKIVSEVQEEIKESTAHKIVRIVINVVLVLAIVLAAFSTYISFVSTSGNGVFSVFGVRIFSVQTGSMSPTLNAGDLIIDSAVKDTSALKVGDIITYWTVINGERVLNTHRITAIYDGGGHRIFATKGDNNTIEDSLTVHESEVVGKYSTKIGGLGKVLDYLQTSTGFLIVVVVPVFVFFLYHLVQFFRVLFEYQNVKNRLKYEQERGRTEDLLEQQQKQMAQAKEQERAALEAELREKLRRELLESMTGQAPPPEIKEAAEPATEKSGQETQPAKEECVKR